jgi:transposase
MYVKHCKLSKYKQEKLLEFFVCGISARTAAEMANVHRNTAIRFFHKLRTEIALTQLNRSEQFCGKIELDESYFGGKRKGKRGRGAGGKVPVFGILKRNGKVYTQVIEQANTETLLPIIRQKIQADSIVYTDGFSAYNILDVSEFKHFRINHSEKFVDENDKKNHINGIENFWNQAKRHLRKFNGIPKQNFLLFLKECEWRFNGENHKSLLKDLKSILRNK